MDPEYLTLIEKRGLAGWYLGLQTLDYVREGQIAGTYHTSSPFPQHLASWCASKNQPLKFLWPTPELPSAPHRYHHAPHQVHTLPYQVQDILTEALHTLSYTAHH